MNIPFDVTKYTIETDRLTLRAFTMDDLQDFFEYASVPGVGESAGWPHHRSIEVTRGVLAAFLERKESFAIFYKEHKKVIGSISLRPSWSNEHEVYKHLTAKEVGYVVSKTYWNKGIATEALRGIIQFAFDELKLQALGLAHFAGNEKSKHIAEKCGFVYVETDSFYSRALQKNFDDIRYILPGGTQ